MSTTKKKDRRMEKTYETRISDKQCSHCGSWMAQWVGFPTEDLCCHCSTDHDWCKK